MKKKLMYCLLLAVVLFALASCGTQTVNIQDYVKVEYSPEYNGYAKPELVVNEDGLNALLDIEKVKKYILDLYKSNENYADQHDEVKKHIEENPDMLPKFTDLFEVDFEKEQENLSNGDVVIVKVMLHEGFAEFSGANTAEVAKKLGIKIEKEMIEYKVEGLKEINTVSIDLEKLFVVDFGKYNGYASPSVKIDSEYLSSIIIDEVVREYGQKFGTEMKSLLLNGCSEWFDAQFEEDYQNLKNGDKIGVKLVMNEAFDKSGITMADLEAGLAINFNGGHMTFDVSGLEEVETVSIDLDQLFNIDFGKYNGYACPSVSINYEYLGNIIVDEILEAYGRNTTTEVKNLILGDCSKWFDAEFDEDYYNLKNGDKVTVNLVMNEIFGQENIKMEDIEKGLAINLNGGSKSYIVSGLEESKYLIDIFEGIEQYIVYTGANGKGKIGYSQVAIPDDYLKQKDDIYFVKGMYTNSVKVIYNNRNLGEIIYYIDGNNLSKGDIITLNANVSIEGLQELGYIIPVTSTKVTVPDLGEYLTTLNQLTPEIVKKISEKVYAKQGIEKIDKLYYTTYKPSVECTYNSTSFMVAIFYKDGWVFDGYRIDELYDIIIKPDGSIVVEEYYEGGGIYDTMEEAESKLATNMFDFSLIELP